MKAERKNLIERLVKMRKAGFVDAGEAAAVLLADAAEIERLQQAHDHQYAVAGTMLREAERTGRERDALLGKTQCFVCGGPATVYWCDLHMPNTWVKGKG